MKSLKSKKKKKQAATNFALLSQSKKITRQFKNKKQNSKIKRRTL